MATPMVMLAILALFVVPGIFMWLWNMTCPQVFKLSEITYWQAFRLLILAALLFGGAHFATQTGTAPGSSFQL